MNSSQCQRKPKCGAVQLERDVARQQVHELRQHREQDAAEEQVKGRQAQHARAHAQLEAPYLAPSGSVRMPSTTNESAAVSGATYGMSVMLWCAIRYQYGAVVSTRPARKPARAPKAFATALYSR